MRRFVSNLTMAFLLVAACLLAGPLHAELIADGGFENGQGSWATTSGAVVDFSHGDARVSQRIGKQNGISYNLLPRLDAGMLGATFTTRCNVTLAAPAPVRIFLRTLEAGQNRVVILAEEVVRDSNIPHELRGTHTFDWTAFPTSAVIEFNIGYDTFDVESLPLGGVFPDYTADDVSIEDDTDGDGLTDAEEATLGTSPLLPDSDDDSLPDAWEHRHGTRPNATSAEDDDDLDGWSNRLEYWAATDPADPASKPGMPSNPNATPAARKVLEYLATLPANGAENHTLVGQHTTNVTDPIFGFAQMVAPLGAPPISEMPGVIAFQFDDGANPPDVLKIRPHVLEHWRAGGLVEIKYNPRHPWTRGMYSNPDPSLVDIDALLNPDPLSPTEMATHDFFIQELDIVAAELQFLRDTGVVVLWRFCSEMGGPHFWWGNLGQEDYGQLWRFFHTYFSDPDGWNLTNLLWVYEAMTPAHMRTPIDYHYPGNEYVDLIGHNFYHDTFRLEFDAEAIMARYPKVYACPQVGPENDPAYRDGNFSNMNYLRGTDQMSGFIHRHPRLSYFAIWDSFTNQGGQNYHHIAIIDNPDALEFMGHPYLVTRDEIPSARWLPQRVPDAWALY